VSLGRALASTAAALAAWAPGRALGCTWCISSAFGDRSFNWPYLGLILVPFLVAVVIGSVLARNAGFELRALLGRRRGRAAALDESEPIKETT
jgi:hypothetical protein